MIEFLRRLFGQQGSSATAKERLRLVLMTDHLELAPEMIDTMKRELVDVISRYVEVDRDRIEVSFERQDRTLAMLANIPILAVNRPNGNGAVAHDTPAPPAQAASAAVVAAEVPAEATPSAQSSPPPRVRRRKRRKKSQSARANLPSTA
jgi:cell division topological specificity factor